MSLPAADVLLHPEAELVLANLEADSNPRKRSIARRIRALRPLLLVDCLHGEVVRKGSIPSVLVARFGIENLYVEDLPDFWRLLYSVMKSSGRPIVVVLAIVDHRRYSRWFPGRRG